MAKLVTNPGTQRHAQKQGLELMGVENYRQQESPLKYAADAGISQASVSTAHVTS